MKFRKKPIVIEARQYTSDNAESVVDWCGADWSADFKTGKYKKYIYIETLEGRMEAVFGDWIIKGVKGEFYPCKDDIFEATYEKTNVKSEVTVLKERIVRLQQQLKDAYYEDRDMPVIG